MRYKHFGLQGPVSTSVPTPGRKLFYLACTMANRITVAGVVLMSAGDKKGLSTLDELIKEKEKDLESLRKLKTKSLEIDFFRGIAGLSTSVATKLEKGETLGPTEQVFRRRIFDGLTIKEILSLLYDKLVRRRKAVIFTPRRS